MNNFQLRFAEIIRQLRENHNLTKSEMANIMCVSDVTYYKYETGASSPTVPQFLELCQELNLDVFRVIYDLLYPDIEDGDTEELRKAAAYFVQNQCPDKLLRELHYIINGNHGSNFYPQAQEFTMINHLPLEYRLIIARDIFMLYDLARDKGELLHTDKVMPDEKAFMEGIRKGREAVKAGKNSYSEFSR